jgi:hypothetical protein
VTRINYTGRKRIPRDRVSLRIASNGGIKLHVTSVELPPDLPPGARVVIEAQRQTRFMRLDCGTVASPLLPIGEPLIEFDVADGIRFRLKVVGASEADEGKILAAADGIVAASDETPSGREPLLAFRPAPLDQRLWKLDISDGAWPVVLVNQSIGDWHQFAREPHFQALVYPEVLRQIALWVVENLEDADEPDTPAGAWRRFLKDLGTDPVEDAPPDEEERSGWAQDWADDVADKFCRRHRFRDLVGTAGEDTD